MTFLLAEMCHNSRFYDKTCVFKYHVQIRLWMFHLDLQIPNMTITLSNLMITELVRNLHIHGRSCVSSSLTKVFIFFVNLQELAYYSHEMSQTSIRR